MRFKDYFSLKHILFALLIFALMIPLAIRDSNNQVKVRFSETEVSTSSNRYSMTVRYDEIESVELTALPDAGEKVENGYDDDILRAGYWRNDVWGEYHITADLDASVCVVMHLKDSRIFVFSSKDDATTQQHFETLQSHLS